MGDIQSHVRLQAIATLSKVAEYKAATEDPFNLAFKDIPLDNPYSRNIPEKLYVALECLLEDSNDRVRCAAAITLYSLNRPCDKVMNGSFICSILKQSLRFFRFIHLYIVLIP